MKGPLFYSKILLFGEYGIIKDSKGLSIPYSFYNGALKMDDNVSEDAIQSNQNLRLFAKHLQTLEERLVSFDYQSLIGWMGDSSESYTWLVFIPIVIFIITAVSNGANLTDGIDGLAAGTSAIIVFALGIFAWVSGNVNFASYLNIMYIPNVGEISIFIAAFLGALIGFLWYNTYPAQVFMGDTGSLAIGAVISVIAIIERKELLIPLLCGVFLSKPFRLFYK